MFASKVGPSIFCTVTQLHGESIFRAAYGSLCLASFFHFNFFSAVQTNYLKAILFLGSFTSLKVETKKEARILNSTMQLYQNTPCSQQLMSHLTLTMEIYPVVTSQAIRGNCAKARQGPARHHTGGHPSTE